MSCAAATETQEPTAGSAQTPQVADIPKDYQLLEESTSPDGGFAILSVKDDGRDAAIASVVALPLSAGASVVDPHGLRVRVIK